MTGGNGTVLSLHLGDRTMVEVLEIYRLFSVGLVALLMVCCYIPALWLASYDNRSSH